MKQNYHIDKTNRIDQISQTGDLRAEYQTRKWNGRNLKLPEQLLINLSVAKEFYSGPSRTTQPSGHSGSPAP